MSEAPALGELSSDDYFLSSADWQAAPEIVRTCYTWQPDIFKGIGNIPDWSFPYRQIFNANVVLQGLSDLPAESGKEAIDKAKGMALFIRAFALHNLAQVFIPVYDETSSAHDLGLPIRLGTNFNDVSTRSSVKQTYERILADLHEAVSLLPKTMDQANPSRPTLPTAYGLLARVYLSMRNYDKAHLYADSSLKIHSSLIDFNSLSTTATNPFKRINDETLYQSKLYSGTTTLNAVTGVIQIDSTLYKSYHANDLRRLVYFRTAGGKNGRKGHYNGTIYCFNGIAVDELYFIRAECLTRLNRHQEGMKDINTVLAKRWKGTFTPLTANSTDEALNAILLERRKELVFRGLRWSDLRRLNKEGRNISPKRSLDGKEYSLPANSKLFVLPIPPDEIALSGIPQNNRE